MEDLATKFFTRNLFSRIKLFNFKISVEYESSSGFLRYLSKHCSCKFILSKPPIKKYALQQHIYYGKLEKY